MLGPAALAQLRGLSARFETFQRLGHDFVAIANCLVLATHLIQDALGDLLVRLARLQQFLRIFNNSVSRGRLRGLIIRRLCINILDEGSLRLLSAVHMEDNWGFHDYFRITLVWRAALHSCHLN